MSTGLIAYLSSVGALTTIGLAATLLWLGSLRKLRVNRLRMRKSLAPLATASPVEHPIDEAKARSIDAVREQFTVTRRLVVPTVLMFAGFLAALPFLSLVPTALASLIVGIAAVIIGIAARPVVENAIAGMVLSSSRHFYIGDTVKLDGHYGTVEDISTTHTTIKLWDWRRYVVPNSGLLQTRVINYTLIDRYQWAYVEFWVSYDADLERVRELAIVAGKASSYFAGHEEPRFWAMECKPEGVMCWVAAWADHPSDAWLLTHDIRVGLTRAFRSEGIHCHRWEHHWDQGTPGAPGAGPRTHPGQPAANTESAG